ncbi:phage holin, LLH family [Limosilactobacillus mucosae]|uniref:phage holin, LLH family n=1 Tax=Limosilactobacillus mucosae TaxID=97478 RepID=UPI00088C79DC|nr:phage holin, LLH family [Limosilactobacillus mucosae]MDM8220054.1 phage holin, LLH family [Limosilactobacillus mucosae]MDM8314710.1 phage holin, LLH family [Limosilactobacillus mucosae]SDN55272.1 Bacteriophage holin of superfamily 6 (Holin_LLH) [Limosilactobacillus mucosae]SEL09973.1 Bacteriophage holin of superfamily 6 (Holin_LLH) [Limosilactobacillus mucosae]SFK23319.1 Bacteriophage holin of superfamily 6 (Holin_LLH) [Limosilactobacillus mucosae]
MTTIVNAIPSYLITVTASVAFFIALKLLQNFIHTKVIRAKTETSRAAWSYAAQLADTAVASLVGKDMAGHEKFRQATQIVQTALEQQGIKNVDLNAIEAMVQAAYEKSPLTPTKQPVDPVKEAIKTAPNRADKLLVTDGSIMQAKG